MVYYGEYGEYGEYGDNGDDGDYGGSITFFWRAAPLFVLLALAPSLLPLAPHLPPLLSVLPLLNGLAYSVRV
jgi:hypothetical protein